MSWLFYIFFMLFLTIVCISVQYFFFESNLLRTSFVHLPIILSNAESENKNLFKKPCNFVTLKYAGGLANKMFQYATFYSVARQNQKNPFIIHRYHPIKSTPFTSGLRFSLVDIFTLTIPVISNDSLQYFETSDFVEIGEHQGYVYDKSVEHLNCTLNYTVSGSRSSWKYFHQYENEIRKEFRFVANVRNECDNVFRNITRDSNKCIMIGVHLRRGDFAFDINVNYGHAPATGEFFRNSVKFFENRYSNVSSCVKFLVVGEDHKWNVENAPNRTNIIFAPDSVEVGVDMCLMTLCNHSIIGAGTYGWWSAYLTAGDVVYMKDQCRPGSFVCSIFKIDDYINPEWKWIPL